MASRFPTLLAAAGALSLSFGTALAAEQQPFSKAAFEAAEAAGAPILVEVHASWCPTCKAQTPILGQLTDDQKFKNLAYFVIDFDGQKELVQRFGARMQSTLIVFKGNAEEGRSLGDTNRASIAALLNKAL